MTTAAELQPRLDAYLAAELAILQGQEYQIGQGSTARRLRRADLSEVRAQISALQTQIAQLAAVRRRGVVYIRPW